MPSKWTVALSLDEETSRLWDELPRGERSKYVREAMNKIDLIRVQEDLIDKLRNRLDAAEVRIADMKLFGIQSRKKKSLIAQQNDLLKEMGQ